VVCRFPTVCALRYRGGQPGAGGASAVFRAEIQVLLALNQLHADRGERIQMLRQPTKFLVRGIVDSVERKRQMESRLHEITNVETEIVTLQQSLRLPAPSTELRWPTNRLH
jgi:hypothetical protein